MDQQSVEDVLIELLAEQQHASADELLQQLLAAGTDLPVDSVLAAEIVASVQTQFGVRFPTDEPPDYLRSVRRFAAKVCALAGDVEAEGAQSA